MQDNVLEIIKRRLENEEEMSFASFEEYAELYGYNETEDFFSFGLKRAIEIVSAYIKQEKDENNIKQEEVQAISIDKVKKAREEILQCKSNCEMSIDEYPSCRECTDNTFDCILSSIDKLIESE